jgi:membrane-associated protease RseP (regulator of RpoE activity)
VDEWARTLTESTPRLRQRPVVHTVLVVATFLTMVAAGAVDAINGSLRDLWQAPQLLARGLPYALALLGVLVAREAGYLIAARVHGLEPALPYFIPIPSLFGTLGTIYVARNGNRRALFDTACSGALCGLIVAVALSVIGIAKSDPVDPGQPMTGSIGSSFAFHWIVHLLRPEASEGLMLHPLAFAGWTGMFVTAVGLIPVGQLDGGHMLYGVLGPRQRAVSWMVIVLLALIGVWWRAHMWVIWPLFLVVLGVRHPDVGGEPLGPGRTALAGFMLLVLLAIFPLVPVSFVFPS